LARPLLCSQVIICWKAGPTGDVTLCLSQGFSSATAAAMIRLISPFLKPRDVCSRPLQQSARARLRSEVRRELPKLPSRLSSIHPDDISPMVNLEVVCTLTLETKGQQLIKIGITVTLKFKDGSRGAAPIARKSSVRCIQVTLSTSNAIRSSVITWPNLVCNHKAATT